jgi:group II intron reverse transcriptase/maturase
MQTADVVLSIYRERGKQGLPLERVYRQLFNRDLYLRAYARLYPNKGALTKGSTAETVDGMTLAKIDRIIDALRTERFHWTPVRRVYIPKKHGTKLRPLGLPSWTDKLLQEVIRSLLEAYYEPQFSTFSHGFRPGRGCHTALSTIQQTWTGTRWFIEGDLASYFDTINHERLLAILSERIHDGRFLHLIRALLKAGYLDLQRYHPTLSGAPQGGVLSPLLSNIYLDQLDQYVAQTLIPAHTCGRRRRRNPAYKRISRQITTTLNPSVAKALRKQRRAIPSIDPFDPDYRRLHYLRYADDFVLGFAGPRAEAEAIKQHIKHWLADQLHLELSEQKTLITHATTQAARFLGYEITNQQENSKLDTTGRRVLNGTISLRVPADAIQKQCARYSRAEKPIHRAELLAESDYSIITTYQQEYRGVVQYYLLAQNVAALTRLHWVTRSSLLKTLAAKYRTSSAAIKAKYRATLTGPDGKRRTGLAVEVSREGKPPLIAHFGGIPLVRTPTAILNDQPTRVWNGRTEILQRLLANECELCGSHEDVEVHHIRKLADLSKPGRRERAEWVKRMIARRRKTLVVCRTCHDAIHAGRPTRQPHSK